MDVLRGTVQARFLKEIFKNLGPKHLKGVEYFYILCNRDQMELQFSANAKDILVTLVLKKFIFQRY